VKVCPSEQKGQVMSLWMKTWGRLIDPKR